MVNLLASILAGTAAVLVGIALFSMSAGNLRVAGFCFLSASLVVYLRETRALGD